MTKEELEKQITEVTNLLGKPEYDEVAYPKEPLNESAKRIAELRKQYKSEKMKVQHEERKALEQQLGADLKTVERIPAKPIYIDDIDLKGFTPVEAAIIEGYYENRDLNQQQLAKQFNVHRQTITKLFKSAKFNILRVKYHEYVMPNKLMLGYEKLVDNGHEKAIMLGLVHYGILKPERTDINITSKPIEDPEALKLLQELGDKWAEQKPEETK